MGHAIEQTAATLAAITDQSTQQYLTFILGAETFAISILQIKEIIEFGNLTEIPMMPDYIRGVLNLRGAAVPVIDLSTRFGGKKTEVGRRTCIVIVEIRQCVGQGDLRQDIGIMVDSVSAVLDIPPTDIEPPPPFGGRIRSDFIYGMGKISGKFVVILNIDFILSNEELAALGGDGIPVPTGAL